MTTGKTDEGIRQTIESVKVERKIYYYQNGEELKDVDGKPAVARQWAEFTREVNTEVASGKVIYGEWTKVDFPGFEVLQLDGFVPDIEFIPEVKGVSPDNLPQDVKVCYASRSQKKVYVEDVSEFDPLLDVVHWSVQEGIVELKDGKFEPDEVTTREQAAVYLWRAFRSPEPVTLNSPFEDVSDKASNIYKAVMWAVENNIVTGSNNRFYPKGGVTREQMITMLWRAAGSPEPERGGVAFSDVNKTSYSGKAVLWAAQERIAMGYKGKFFPTGECRKKETLTFLYRFFNKEK